MMSPCLPQNPSPPIFPSSTFQASILTPGVREKKSTAPLDLTEPSFILPVPRISTHTPLLQSQGSQNGIHSRAQSTNEACRPQSPVHPPRGAHHLPARLSRLQFRFVHFHPRCLRSSINRMDVGDVEALVAGSKYIKALIPAVVNIVYKKLLESDITARAFHTRDTADDTPVEEFFTEESPQIQRRKMFLRWYLIKLCSDPSQMEFWRYLNKVGYVFLSLSRSVCTKYHVTLTVIE